MHLIDSHCHLDFNDFDKDRTQVLKNCQKQGIQQLIVPGVIATDWQHLLTVCQESTMLYPALGLHPMFMQHHQPKTNLCALKSYIETVPIIAIGEIGLDFYQKNHNKTEQIFLFSQQLQLAQQTELPIILHVRKAHDLVLSLLKRFPVKGGIVHAFNGSLQQAENYQRLNFLLGVGGTVTYSNASRLRRLFQTVPLNSLALETDAPDMPLSDMASQRNTPENITTILEALVDIRQETKQEIAKATTENCQKLFNFDRFLSYSSPDLQQ